METLTLLQLESLKYDTIFVTKHQFHPDSRDTVARWVKQFKASGTALNRKPTVFDGATAHTASKSMEILKEMFPSRLISLRGDIAWPARSPLARLGTLRFFFFGVT